MPEEIGKTIDHLIEIDEKHFGDLTVYRGKWISSQFNGYEIYITTAWSGWGKVSSSRAATRLIQVSSEKSKIDLFIFTGVAGGLREDVNQWDLVLASQLIQHDMDASPLFPKYVIPALNKKILKADNKIINWAFESINKFKIQKKLKKFSKVHLGLIATGDRFITSKNCIQEVCKDFLDIYAVEMEGSAVAQVAIQEEIPWLVLRTISDGANVSSSEDFNSFITNYNLYSWELIEALLFNLNKF